MTQLSPKTIIKTAEIPSLPHALQKILSLADNPRTSSTDLERIVVQDAGLVTNLLRLVNSAYYALPQKISSLGHAMILLGFSTVKSIAAGLSLIDAFHNMPGLNKAYFLTIWKTSLISSHIMKVLTRRERGTHVDDLFLAAMIADVGHIVLSQFFKGQYDELTRNNPHPSVDLEDRILKINHAEVGAVLLEEWRFPPTVISCVRYHHRRDHYEGEPRYMHFLDVAITLSEVPSGLGDYLFQPLEAVDPSFLHKLELIGWTWEKLQAQKEELEHSIQEIEAFLSK